MINYLTSKIQQKFCLATVSNKEYWSGTKTMISSFLKYNQWFTGDIIIISDDKFFQSKKLNYKNSFFKTPDDQLTLKVETLTDTIQNLKEIKDRFYCLDVFNIIEYDYIIYADSDLLFSKGLDPDILFKNYFMAVLDPWHYRGYKREYKTCKKLHHSNITNEVYFNNFFNSGFLVLSKNIRTNDNYLKLLEYLSVANYLPLKDKLADESCLNYIFNEQVSFLPVQYNCPVHLLIEGIVKNQPKTTHFTGKYKPWKLKSWLILPIRNLKYFKYLVRWLSINIGSTLNII